MYSCYILKIMFGCYLHMKIFMEQKRWITVDPFQLMWDSMYVMLSTMLGWWCYTKGKLSTAKTVMYAIVNCSSNSKRAQGISLYRLPAIVIHLRGKRGQRTHPKWRNLWLSKPRVSVDCILFWGKEGRSSRRFWLRRSPLPFNPKASINSRCHYHLRRGRGGYASAGA